mgnify:CR=1 FL=1
MFFHLVIASRCGDNTWQNCLTVKVHFKAICFTHIHVFNLWGNRNIIQSMYAMKLICCYNSSTLNIYIYASFRRINIKMHFSASLMKRWANCWNNLSKGDNFLHFRAIGGQISNSKNSSVVGFSENFLNIHDPNLFSCSEKLNFSILNNCILWPKRRKFGFLTFKYALTNKTLGLSFYKYCSFTQYT